MFDQIIGNLCTYMAFKAGCQETFKAAGAQSHVSKDIDDSEQEFIKVSTKEVYDFIGKKTVEYSIAAGFIANSVITKSVQIQAPLKPLVDEIKLNGSNPDPNVNAKWDITLNWKWNLP